ncbi:hypothetical protein LGQ03_02650 [Loktanella sp. TSTF-M6]|uniref:Transferrin-binding protein B C-lobe/N-lobe beta barrel domain-containing protein n=1 Tax=Loktanella gaetbuli TaxID=2881335 RepID=A0ABS8BQX7_9RHOB|nr:hypothetical protein [Loktanella gaetbuli]MCB5198130.1 hypothetical protein [Loktanella gaetbuli]
MPRFISLIPFFIFAACGGGGGGDDDAGPDRFAVADRLESRLAEQDVSDPGTLPVTGRANYTGFMRAGLPTGAGGARVEYLGDLRMDVNFGAARDEVAGSATGFQTGAGDRLSGTLTISDGDLFRDTDPDENYTFTGDVDGTLKRGADSYRIDAEIEGEFKGRDREGVSGLLFGDVRGPDGQDVFDGSFAAVKEQE